MRKSISELSFITGGCCWKSASPNKFNKSAMPNLKIICQKLGSILRHRQEESHNT